ncbi:MAG: hypothetical protein ACFFCS_01890 [Candidatus Hodarchaeota archaeon]
MNAILEIEKKDRSGLEVMNGKIIIVRKRFEFLFSIGTLMVLCVAVGMNFSGEPGISEQTGQSPRFPGDMRNSAAIA